MQTLSAVQGVLGQCEAGPWGNVRGLASVAWLYFFGFTGLRNAWVYSRPQGQILSRGRPGSSVQGLCPAPVGFTALVPQPLGNELTTPCSSPVTYATSGVSSEMDRGRGHEHTHTHSHAPVRQPAPGSRRTHGLDAGRPFRQRGRPLWWGRGIGGRGYGFISQRVALPSSFPSLLFKSPLDAAELELSPLHELWAPHKGLPKAPQKQLVTVTSLSLVWEKQRRHATNRVLSLCLSSRKGGTVRKALGVSGH